MLDIKKDLAEVKRDIAEVKEQGEMRKIVDKSFLLQSKMLKAVEIFVGLIGANTTERLQLLKNAATAFDGHFRVFFAV
ncbi:hypothetical protein RvY_17379 [Ramazzottius varieornatus]|uniref:Uncharacterized protein n=1 Tax=Ramazzottius varieornatus TaxID=947166 RepID=A0A1D1W2R2_RAMVA|nr:hypothetical protein RvY_17379 [Ramazzottius varieornatus]